MIHHITAEDNVIDGKVVNPLMIKHGIVTAMRISDLSGWVDPATHLNLDFPKHLVRTVIVADRLEINGAILREGERYAMALIDRTSYQQYGPVDEEERQNQLKSAVHRNEQYQ
jgi:hypothetical protein